MYNELIPYNKMMKNNLVDFINKTFADMKRNISIPPTSIENKEYQDGIKYRCKEQITNMKEKKSEYKSYVEQITEFIDKMEKEIRDAESQQQINREKMVEPMRAKSRSRSRSRDREEEQQLERASKLLAKDRGYTPAVAKTMLEKNAKLKQKYLNFVTTGGKTRKRHHK